MPQTSLSWTNIEISVSKSMQRLVVGACQSIYYCQLHRHQYHGKMNLFDISSALYNYQWRYKSIFLLLAPHSIILQDNLALQVIQVNPVNQAMQVHLVIGVNQAILALMASLASQDHQGPQGKEVMLDHQGSLAKVGNQDRLGLQGKEEMLDLQVCVLYYLLDFS